MNSFKEHLGQRFKKKSTQSTGVTRIYSADSVNSLTSTGKLRLSQEGYSAFS